MSCLDFGTLIFVLTCVYFCSESYGVERHFQQYFSYTGIVAVSFIGGGNPSTWRKHRSDASH
jgi:hypothetical protein